MCTDGTQHRDSNFWKNLCHFTEKKNSEIYKHSPQYLSWMHRFTQKESIVSSLMEEVPPDASISHNWFPKLAATDNEYGYIKMVQYQ